MGSRALDDLGDVMALVRVTGPRFFGYVLGSGEPVGAAADLLASVLNQNVTAWRSSPSAVTIERVVVGWLAEAIGCAGFTGSLTGGGSSANLMGLAMAREARLPANESGARPGTVYASEEVHMSIPKAIALLGIGRENLRLIPCDDNFQIRVDLLRASMERDVRAGLTPIAIVGSAGTVSTGSIDPLPRVGGNRARIGRLVSRGRGLWRAGRHRRTGEICRAEPGRFAVARSPQVAVSAARLRMPALSRCCRRAPRLLAHRRLRQIAGERSGRGLRVLRGNHRAVATLSCAEALAVAALSRAGEISRGDPQRFSTRAAAGRADCEAARAGTAGAGPAQRSLLPLSSAGRC